MERQALKKMTVAELRDLAKELPDVKGVSAMKKDDLVELLAGRTGPEGEAPQARAAMPEGGGPRPAQPGGTLGKAEIKERIRALKAEKRAALDQQDRVKSRACNRKIHDYKRQLRKMARAKKTK
jgi:hypothetical protein